MRRLLRPQTVRAALVPAVAILTLVAACARGRPVADAEPVAAIDTTRALVGPAVLEVRNGSNYDVTVFVLQGGRRERVGLVGSGATASFQVADHHIGREVRFLADPVGFNRSQRTDAMYLRPGVLVVFGLERLLRSHTVSVF